MKTGHRCAALWILAVVLTSPMVTVAAEPGLEYQGHIRFDFGGTSGAAPTGLRFGLALSGAREFRADSWINNLPPLAQFESGLRGFGTLSIAGIPLMQRSLWLNENEPLAAGDTAEKGEAWYWTAGRWGLAAAAGVGVYVLTKDDGFDPKNASPAAAAPTVGCDPTPGSTLGGGCI